MRAAARSVLTSLAGHDGVSSPDLARIISKAGGHGSGRPARKPIAGLRCSAPCVCDAPLRPASTPRNVCRFRLSLGPEQFLSAAWSNSYPGTLQRKEVASSFLNTHQYFGLTFTSSLPNPYFASKLNLPAPGFLAIFCPPSPRPPSPPTTKREPHRSANLAPRSPREALPSLPS